MLQQQEIGSKWVLNPLLTQQYSKVKKIKDNRFSVEDIEKYTLSLLIGIHDFQLAITDFDGRVLLIEDFSFSGVKTVNSRISILREIFDNHHLLKAGFWKEIKLALKTHKFTLMPSCMFIKTAAIDYLSLNSEIKTSMEEVYHYKHTMSDMVNIFTGDIKLIKWIRSIYPKKKIRIFHQGSAFIEGISKYDNHLHNKSMFCLFDKRILHIAVTEKQNLFYYNQFATKKDEESHLRFILLVFKELGLNQKETKLTIWGIKEEHFKNIKLIKKHIKYVSYGTRPSTLKLGYQFDDIPEYTYFDLLSMYLFV